MTGAATGSNHAEPLPPELWPVAVGPTNAAAATKGAYLQKLRSNGVNALVLQPSLKPRLRDLVRKSAERAGLLVVLPVKTRAAARRCSSLCALSVPTAAAAVKAARSNLRIVVVQVRGPHDTRFLNGLKSGRVLAVPVLNARPRFDAVAWKSAIASARSDPRLDLGVAPTGTAPLNAYLSLLGPKKTATAAPIADGALGSPSGVRALSQTSTSIMLSWNAAPGAVQYGVYRDGASAGTSAVNSMPVTGLACNTSYLLEVDAVSSTGARSPRTPLRASTSACGGGGAGGSSSDTSAPTTPSSLLQGVVTATSATLTWTASTDNLAVARYDLYRSGAYAGTTAGLAFTFPGLSCATSYTVGLEAVDAAGNRSSRASRTVTTSACAPGADTSAPSAPSGFTRIGSTQTSITMSWSASSDNVGVSGYGAYRSGSLVASTTSTSYTFTGLSCGTSYSLGVDAYDAASNRSVRTSTSASTSACPADTSAPTAPASISLVTAAATSVSISWPAATDNVAVAGYGVYRNGTSIGSTSASTRSFTFVALACGTTYSLGVDAYDATGNRSSRTTLSAATSTCPPPGAVATRYVATNGSDSSSCTQAAPCASFMRAYEVAAAGDTVEVAAGSYPTQTMTEDADKTSGSVTFRPASGAAVAINRIQLEGASYLTFRDMTVNSRMIVENSDPGTTGSHDILFENMRAQTFRFVGQVSNITVRGGEFGTTVDNQPQLKKYNQSDPDSSRPFNILIENNWFHDFTRSGSSIHTECLQIINANTVTIRSNRFNVCDGTGAIGITDGPTDNLTIDNNFFGNGGDAFHAVQITKTTRNLVFRNNSLAKAFIFSDTESGGPYIVTSNYAPHNSSTCTSGATYAFNVFDGGTCGVTDFEVGALRFVDEDGFDLHLRADSEAIGRGDPTSYPPTDIDGDPRPRGGSPDAGADEF